MSVERGDVDDEPLQPGWIPEGWEKGDAVEFKKGWNQFTFNRIVLPDIETMNEPIGDERVYHFDNYRLPEFFNWLDWWYDD